jgi:hypothetical protein
MVSDESDRGRGAHDDDDSAGPGDRAWSAAGRDEAPQPGQYAHSAWPELFDDQAAARNAVSEELDTPSRPAVHRVTAAVGRYLRTEAEVLDAFGDDDAPCLLVAARKGHRALAVGLNAVVWEPPGTDRSIEAIERLRGTLLHQSLLTRRLAGRMGDDPDA